MTNTVVAQGSIESLPACAGKNWKLLFFFFILATGLTAFTLICVFPARRIPLFLCGFSLSFASMLGLRHSWPGEWGCAHVLLLAIIARCFLLPLAPSDDLNRYLWEGKCQLHNINPYIVPPIDSQTAPFRDLIWQGINHKEFTSIYGPLAQLIFKAGAFIRYSPYVLKVILTLFDLGTLLLLLIFLTKRKSRLNEAILYAVNPLVLFSFAGEGHLECLLLFMLAAAMLMYRQKYFAWLFIFHVR